MMSRDDQLELHFGGYGKLPTQGDFLRVPSHVHELEPLDHWLQSAMLYARHSLGPRYQLLYETQLYHRFLFRGERGQCSILGVIRSASDAHQRLYPFVSYALISRSLLDRYPSLLSALHDELFELLESRIGLALEQSSAGAIIELMNEPAEIFLDLEGCAHRYMNFLQDWDVDDIGQSAGLHGSSVLEELLAAIEVVRTSGRRVSSTAFALPLSARSNTSSLELRFWIELYLLGFQLRQMLPTNLSLFWPAHPENSIPPMLHLTPRPPTEPLLASMLSSGAGQVAVWAPGLDPNPYATNRSVGPTIPMGTRLLDILRALAPQYPYPCSWI